MANFVYTEAKRAMGNGEIKFATDDIRVLLVMTNTTAASAGQEDVATIGDFTTLDEYDGTNYTSPGKSIVSPTWTKDSVNNRAEFDGDNITWASLGAGTRQCQAAILYKFVTTLNSSVPIAYIDTGGFPFAGDGTDVTLQWNSEGICQLT